MSIATLLLARTHTVVIDADRAADAATRPARDDDIDRFEVELLQLGFVMSLDLAMTVRRMPHEALRELQSWMLATLAPALPPHVPLARGAEDAYAQRAITWLATCEQQPCPWCAQPAPARALDPCGHLVCTRCWSSGTFAGCPICHRRVAMNDPFLHVPEGAAKVERHDGRLALLHLAFDVAAVAQHRFVQMLSRAAPLSSVERTDLEALIDALGPKVALWLPKRIPVRENMAIALARLWMVAPDRVAMMKATHAHVASATDVLRIAAVLMQGNAALVEPMRLASVPRNMRRALLGALEKLPLEPLIEDMRRHRALWKRVGERLHPGEHELPNVAAAFAAVRGKPAQPTWAGRVETALAERDAHAAAALLAERPTELLLRADHLLRLDPSVVGTICNGMKRGVPGLLLQLAAHFAGRVDAIVTAARRELLVRAATRRNFARAVIDRGLAAIPLGRPGSRRPTVWDAVAIHAAARANTIYVRDAGAIAIYKRRDDEPPIARLARLHAGEHDGTSKIPPANAPTWFALLVADLALPKGSEGYVHGDDARALVVALS